MPVRGDVYLPKGFLPPGSLNRHFCVVLSNIPIGAPNALHVMVAIIRSAIDNFGKPVPKVLVHSIPLTQQDCIWLKHDSILETHQLFPLLEAEFKTFTPIGTLPPDKLDEALIGARRLFS